MNNTVFIPTISDLYQLSIKDYKLGCNILGEAFRDDPIWSKIMEEQPDKFNTVFGVPLKYCLRFGKVFAPSRDLEGLAAWIGSPYTNMSIWRLIISGAFIPSFQLGVNIGQKIFQVFSVIEKDRKEFMKEAYVYLYVIGVHPSKQGQGIGTKLIRSMLEILPKHIPIYLETETQDNVKFYEKLGFEILNEIKVPLFDLPMWEMISNRE
ncbi:MAG: GNAT family N-acetyltransferase [Candidatus Lokiarchaeota archaeon]|nr:GNAT family N-acetyltransferase [Candidatus Lokiarchaeota archaeon]